MILTKDFLTKATKKGRTKAITLLNQIAVVGKLPLPHYEYVASGTTRRPWHYFRVRFRVPQFLRDTDKDFHLWEHSRHGDTVVGAGKDTNKQFAKSLAALEVIHRLEQALQVKRNDLPQVLETYQQTQREKQQALEATPVTQQIQGVSWTNLPFDPQFAASDNRVGRIQFFASVCADPDALLGARAITLSAKNSLPKVEHHSNQRDQRQLQNWANILANGKIRGVNGPTRAELVGLTQYKAEFYALQVIGRDVALSGKVDDLANLLRERSASFGMAKLFVRLPEHRFDETKALVKDILANEHTGQDSQGKSAIKSNPKSCTKRSPRSESHEILQDRIASFRSHQKRVSLPVDQVEEHIPRDAAVTIVRGGTGSGKTTRYPLMLSLFTPDAQCIVVAQPRRLACQAAAQRVAYEQDVASMGRSMDSPIGYSIRFESKPSSPSRGNTIDFETPGVILRRATQDPLLSNLTHLVIDEVHERNADMDLLLALAKKTQASRQNHPILPPLKIILMSATLDTGEWEEYFQNQGQVAVVDVPDSRRFPIDIIHAGDKGFPKNLKASKWLVKGRGRSGDELDDNLCQACAELTLQLVRDNKLNDGSILCFLPGMDEIQTVKRLIQQNRERIRARICILHSSIDSREQTRVFQSGAKIILSTNIAETSLTIPDVKIVIDSGRERQYSLMESSSTSRNTTVVGSQLATVDISRASAKQRAGRAGRVSAGTCYRLYTREDLEAAFTPFAIPEIQRMELSQLVLHSLSLFHPSSGHPLSLLLGAPDPPSHLRLRQTLYAMSQQSLVTLGSNHRNLEQIDVDLTPLGSAVAGVPASPRIARMLFMGLAIQSIDSALTIASLLSVPKAFRNVNIPDDSEFKEKICSDVVVRLLAFDKYRQMDRDKQKSQAEGRIFDQVIKVRRQLEKAIQDHLPGSTKWGDFNTNNSRVAAQAALICGATPHIAHLVSGKANFATRDVSGTARIHPSSVNFDNDRRTHWYLYHELRTTKAPYLHVTTAASPLELALFCDSSAGITKEQVYSDREESEEEDPDEEWMDPWKDAKYKAEWQYIADQWVPVAVSKHRQREHFIQLRRVLNYHMLQQVASDPQSFVYNQKYQQLILCILASMEQERLPM